MRNILIVLVIVAIAVAAWFLLPREPEAPPEPPPPVEAPERVEPLTPQPAAEPVEDIESEVEDMLPEEPARAPLPPLDNSDQAALDTAGEVVGPERGTGLLVEENVIPRIVATIDALTARQVPGKLLPMEPPGTPFQANVDPDPPTTVRNSAGDVLEQYTVDPVSYRRYEPYVETFESIETERLAAEYLHYAPLLQQAYTDLGYPEGDFTQRLLEVIDHLLATPDVRDPVQLVKPEAYYRFVDPDLEALSAGQKLLIRMGSENRQRVKDKLVQIRAALGG